MKFNTTKFFSRKPLLAGATSLALFLMMLAPRQSNAQQYASSQTNTHQDESFQLGLITYTADGSVSNPQNAVGGENTNFATLNTEGIKLTSAVTISSSASITLNLPNSVPAGKHTFVRIDAPVTGGISLDLSNLVNLLGLLTNNTIIASTNAGNATSRLVRDASNNLYLEVTSSAAYSAVTVTLDFGGSTTSLGALLSIGTLTMNVYHAVTYENDTFGPCALRPTFTGISPTQDLLNVNVVTLTNPSRAIDGIIALNNYSLLRKDVGVLSSVSQSFYLGKTAPGSNEIVATLSEPTGLLDATVLSSISITAYNGSAQVATRTIESLLLEVGLLGSFGPSSLSNVAFAPNADYDRIVVSSNGGVNALVSLAIHELASRPPITFTGGKVAGGVAGTSINSSIFDATSTITPALPGFSIGCETETAYSYALFNVDQSGARVLAGSLPPSLSLSLTGTLSGNTAATEFGTYQFDVLAANSFGQRAVATFVVELENPLPVTLVSFKAVAEGNTAALSWSTSAETNSDRFDIERSQNGKSWTKIGSVKSHQESSVARNYTFVDAMPLNGNNLYRLKMIDLDETFAYSSVENVAVENAAFVYPNPVRESENLNLNLSDWSMIKTVKVVNASGKIVFESANALSTGISTRNLQAGIYLLQVVRKDGNVLTHKFIRQ